MRLAKFSSITARVMRITEARSKYVLEIMQQRGGTMKKINAQTSQSHTVIPYKFDMASKRSRHWPQNFRASATAKRSKALLLDQAQSFVARYLFDFELVSFETLFGRVYGNRQVITQRRKNILVDRFFDWFWGGRCKHVLPIKDGGPCSGRRLPLRIEDRVKRRKQIRIARAARAKRPTPSRGKPSRKSRSCTTPRRRSGK
jgi:hypothetical protein